MFQELKLLAVSDHFVVVAKSQLHLDYFTNVTHNR